MAASAKSGEIVIRYDSSAPEAEQFRRTDSNVFLSASEAQYLVNNGLGRIVIGSSSPSSALSSLPNPSSASSSGPSTILYDPECTYWSCYYNSDTDRFLTEDDAKTLVDTGLGELVQGRIPYVVTKLDDVYFDVVADREISEEEALTRKNEHASFVLKDKSSPNENTDKFEDASASFPQTPSVSSSTLLSTSTLPPLPPPTPTSLPPTVSYAPHPTSLPTQSRVDVPPSYSTSSCYSSNPPGASRAKQKLAQKEGPSFLEKAVPIAAGVAVAGVAVAGLAFAIFSGSGEKKGKGRKRN